MEDVCKFQLSKFLNGNRDYQVVVRAQTIEEFKKAIEEMKTVVEALEKKQQQEKLNSFNNTANSLSNLKGHCSLHNVEMKMKTGQYGDYWSHYHTDEQGNNWWCDGKKLKPAKNYDR